MAKEVREKTEKQTAAPAAQPSKQVQPQAPAQQPTAQPRTAQRPAAQLAPRAPRPERKAGDNAIYIGNKPAMAYVLAVVTQFGSGLNEVNVKARGRAISRAVDVVEIVRNRFAKDAKIKDIKLGTDRVKTQEGREINVSSIDIVLAK